MAAPAAWLAMAALVAMVAMGHLPLETSAAAMEEMEVLHHRAELAAMAATVAQPRRAPTTLQL